MTGRKKVLVSGCYDLLHSGHVRFFETASEYGDLYVSVASDKTIREYKKREPVYDEKERVYMIRSIRFVKDAFISRPNNKDVMFNFLDDFYKLKPDYLVVNDDGDLKEKRKLCQENGVEYVVLERVPRKGLPKRSTTELIDDMGE